MANWRAECVSQVIVCTVRGGAQECCDFLGSMDRGTHSCLCRSAGPGSGASLLEGETESLHTCVLSCGRAWGWFWPLSDREQGGFQNGAGQVSCYCYRLPQMATALNLHNSVIYSSLDMGTPSVIHRRIKKM